MGKRTRIFVEGLSLHVVQKGNNGCNIFQREADFEVFLSIARSAAAISGVAVHGFVCMTTHYHLIVTPDASGSLPRMMKRLDARYVRYFNRTYGRTGTLWNGRYSSYLIETEAYWLTCLRYVEQNPVSAGMVATADAYRWSSYSVHASGDGPEWLTSHAVYHALGATPETRQTAYRAICGSPLSEAQSVLIEEALVGA